jgi:hypothetical protein
VMLKAKDLAPGGEGVGVGVGVGLDVGVGFGDYYHGVISRFYFQCSRLTKKRNSQ